MATSSLAFQPFLFSLFTHPSPLFHTSLAHTLPSERGWERGRIRSKKLCVGHPGIWKGSRLVILKGALGFHLQGVAASPGTRRSRGGFWFCFRFNKIWQFLLVILHPTKKKKGCIFIIHVSEGLFFSVFLKRKWRSASELRALDGSEIKHTEQSTLNDVSLWENSVKVNG